MPPVIARFAFKGHFQTHYSIGAEFAQLCFKLESIQLLIANVLDEVDEPKRDCLRVNSIVWIYLLCLGQTIHFTSKSQLK